MDGTLEEFAPTDDEDVVANSVSRAESGLAFHLATDVEPLVAHLLLYENVGPTGIPARDDAELVDCFGGSSCTVERSADGTTIDISYGEDADRLRIAVLYVEFATEEPADVREDVPVYRASWVTRLVP